MSSCKVMRRKLVTHALMPFGAESVDQIKMTREEWVDEPCGAPLFSRNSIETGVCQSCANGWTHEHNFKIEPVVA